MKTQLLYNSSLEITLILRQVFDPIDLIAVWTHLIKGQYFMHFVVFIVN